MIKSLLDALFPPRCLGCRGLGIPFCAACAPRVASLDPPGCLRCGRPLEWPVERCADCPPEAIGRARAAFLYDGPVRRALMSLKFGGLRANAEPLADWMVRALGPMDTHRLQVTWVPLGRRRLSRRGFDQAEALARAVAARLDVAPARRLLRRTTETEPQARRVGAARRQAVRGAFLALARQPQRVLLIDDVLTSGATAAECARVLRRAGAEEVVLLTAARSLGGAVPARCYNPAGLWPGSVVARENVSR